MQRPAYFTVSLPTPPKGVSVILDDNTDMLKSASPASHLYEIASATNQT
jgi:hypothetical protein